MARWRWKGPGNMKRVGIERASKPEVTEPSDVGQASSTSFVKCTVEDCGRKFKKNMIMARHFNSSHEDLREDKDSWREWAQEVEA